MIATRIGYRRDGAGSSAQSAMPRSCSNASALVRRHWQSRGACQLATSVPFRWRVELGYGRKEKVKLASVELADGASRDAGMSSPAPLVLWQPLWR